MLELIKCDDILQGIPVQWIGYTPPGGKGWRKLYTENLAPIIAEYRAKAEASKKAMAERERTAAKIRNLATDTAAKWAELSSALSSAGLDVVHARAVAMRVNEIQAATRGILGGLDSFVIVPEDMPKSAEIDEDIRFFDAFSAYIDEDAELDRVLYALFTVDMKYRTKLLRAAYRMLGVVEEAREVLRHSKSMVFKALKPKLGPVIEVLDNGYATIAPAIRKFKKEYAKSGAEALASIDYTFMKGKEG